MTRTKYFKLRGGSTVFKSLQEMRDGKWVTTTEPVVVEDEEEIIQAFGCQIQDKGDEE